MPEAVKSQRKFKLVGVSGASCSGKSVLCRYLHSIFPNSSIISQDSFFKSESEVPLNYELNIKDWDCEEALWMDRFQQALQLTGEELGTSETKCTSEEKFAQVHKAQESSLDSDIIHKARQLLPPSVLETTAGNVEAQTHLRFVDGFLMYHSHKLLNSFDIKFFVKTEPDMLRQRREGRAYPTVDGWWQDPPSYFDTLVWPRHWDYHRHLYEDNGFEKNRIHVLDGNLSLETVVLDATTVTIPDDV